MRPREHIYPVVLPKWGLTMQEGLLAAWHVAEGAQVAAGDELLEIETSKITNTVEAAHGGMLRRQLAEAGKTYPCGALLAVIADASVPDEEIAAFVAKHASASREVPSEPSSALPQVLQVSNRALRYLAQGAGGVPILFIHGFGGELNNWVLVQSPLSENRATYAVDLPGHGGSSKDLAGIKSLGDVADRLVEFIHHLGINRVHVVAHSMGAAVALAIGRQHSARVASLTLLSPAGLGVAPSAEFVNGLIAAGNRREMSAVLKMLLFDESRISRDMVNDFLKYKRLDGAEDALRVFAQLLSDETRSASDALTCVSSPVHVIWGAQDRIMRLPDDQDFPDNVRLSVLEDTGHMPHIERSSQTLDLIRSTVGE